MDRFEKKELKIPILSIVPLLMKKTWR